MAYYCPNCGEPVKNSARFCENCGVQLMEDLDGVDVSAPASVITDGNQQYEARNDASWQDADDDYEEVEPQSDPYREYLRHTYDYKGSDRVEQRAAYTSSSSKIDYERYASYNWPVRNRITAGVLAIVLGGLGIHKFYLGKIGQGILMLLFAWTGIPGIIGLIQGIIYLTEGDEEFCMKNQVRVTD